MTTNPVKLLAALFLFMLFCLPRTHAQNGFIYVHVKALNEESSVNFPFSITGGPTSISAFTLNDLPTQLTSVQDIGAGHGTGGDAELWASVVSTNLIYRRASGSTQWVSTGSVGTNVDGAGAGQYVFVNSSGSAFFFNGTSTQTIYNPTLHLSVRATDITYGNGRIAIVCSDGSILANNSTGPSYTDSWNTILAAGSTSFRLDMLPSTGNIVYMNNSGQIFKLPFSGGATTAIGKPSSGLIQDVAYDDNGTIYCNGSRYSGTGTTWIDDATKSGGFFRTTAGAAGQVWCLYKNLYNTYSIFSRASTGNGTWLDDERVRTASSDNSIMIPVAAGTYNLNLTIPSGWDLSGFDIYDSTANSSGDASTGQATLNVAAGEVVHIVARVALLSPLTMQQVCATRIIEDFGTSASAPAAITAYHYRNGSYVDDGYYSIQNTSGTNWSTKNLADHTTGTGNYMIINAAYSKDEFYRKRVTNLIPGETYQLGFWVSNLSPGASVKPNVQAAAANVDGTLLSSVNTGTFTNTAWVQYTFNFVAQNTTQDIILSNNANGGAGNDLAVDDISLNPYIALSQNVLTSTNLCLGSTYTITNATSGGTWSSYDPSVASVNSSGVVTTVAPGFDTVYYSVTNGFQCTAVQKTPIKVFALPTVAATAGSTAVCLGNTVSLTGTVSGGAGSKTYLWTASPASGAGIVGTAVQSTSAKPTALNTYTYNLKVTDSVGCTANANTAAVQVNPLPTASIAYANTPYCGTGTASVTRTGTAGGTYTAPAAVSIDAATGDINLAASSAGTYTITYTFTDGNSCTNTAQATITINAPPTVSAAGTDQTQYNSGVFTLAGNAPASGTGQWSVVSGNATIANPSNPQTTVTLGANTTATLRWTITAVSPCAPSTDDVVLTYTLQADLAVSSMDDNTTPFVPGATFRYTIVVQNNGPSDVPGATVSVPLPAGITNASWTATGSNGATVSNSSGTGAVNELVNIPANGSVTYIFTISTPSNFSGDITHAASASVPSGIVESNTANNTTSHTDAPNPKYSVQIVNTAPATAVAGGAINFQVSIVNNGPTDLINADIQELIPDTIGNVSWTITTQGAATANVASGTGNAISFTGNLPVGSGNTILLNIAGTVNPSITNGTVTTTAIVTPPGNTAVVSNTTQTVIQSQTGLQILNSGPASGTITAGTQIVYTVTVTNGGPSDANNLTIADLIPADVTGVSWTVMPQGTATITTTSGTGNNINFSGSNIPAGAGNSIVIQISGTVNPAATNTLNTNATASLPDGTSVASATVTTINRLSQLDIAQSGPATIDAGTPISYTITVVNNGPSDATGAVISDLIPASIDNVSWTATASGNASVTSGAAGTGNNIQVGANIAAGTGNIITIQVNGTVNAAAAGSLTNAAIVTGTDGNADTATVNTVITSRPGVAISNSGPSSIGGGQQLTYTIEVINNGPSDALNLLITDTAAAQLTNVQWTASAQGTALVNTGATGTGNQVSLNAKIPAGSGNKILVTVTGTVNPDYTGTILNTATADPQSSPAVVSAVVNTVVTSNTSVNIQEAGPSTIGAGEQITYTLVVGNNGPSNANGVVVSDTLPADITGVTWTAVTNGGATLVSGATGTGNIIELTGNIPAGSGNTITVTITGKVNPTYAGTLSTTASAAPAGAAVVTATPVNTLVINQPGTNITLSGPPALKAGQQITYSIAVGNNGPSDAINAIITDTLAAQIGNVSWTTSVQGAATVSAGASGTGGIINLTGTIPAGTSNKILVTVTGIVNPSFAGTLIDSAFVAVPGQAVISSSPVTTVVTTSADLNIRNDGPQTVAAGENIEYRVLVTNYGPSDANNSIISDTIPTEIENVVWSATVNGTAVINGTSSGIGNLITLNANLPSGGSNTVVIMVKGRVKSATPITTLNSNSSAIPAAGITDPSPAFSLANTQVINDADLQVVQSAPSSRAVNQSITYIINVTNNGVSDVTGALIQDAIPSNITNVQWTATGIGAATVTAGNTGTGNNVSVTGNLTAAIGDTLRIVVTGTVQTAGTISNTAIVTAPSGVNDANTNNNNSIVNTTVTNDVGVVVSMTGMETVDVGGRIRYTIEVSNTGLTDANGVSIKDLLPAELTNITWTVNKSGNAGTSFVANTAQNQNNIDVTANIEGTANGPGTIIIQVEGIVSQAAGATITNTATATFGNQQSSTFVTSVNRNADLRIGYSGPDTARAGEPITYIIDVYNAGPAEADGDVINDLLPSQITNVTWTATSSGTASIVSGQSGTGSNVTVSANLPPGSDNRIRVVVNGIIATNFNGTINSTATAVASADNPDPTPASASVSTFVSIQPNVRITETGPASLNAGEPITYTVTITNGGPSTSRPVIDNIIDTTAIQNVQWSATTTGAATITGGNISGQTSGKINFISTVPAGGNNAVLITITGNVRPDFSGTIVNNTSATRGGITLYGDTIRTVVNTSPVVRVNLSGPAAVGAGENVAYTIVVTNNGSPDANNISLSDLLPPGLLNPTWSATASGAASIVGGNVTGQAGNVSLNVNIPAGGGNNITIVVQGSTDPASNDTLFNTATAAPQGYDTVSSSTIRTVVTPRASISVSESGPAAANAGQAITYTIDVTNAGPSPATNLAISNLLPVQLNNISWTATAIGNAAVNAGASGTGNSLAVTGNIAAGTGNAIQIVVNGTIDPAFAGTISNTTNAVLQGNPAVISDTVKTLVQQFISLNLQNAAPVQAVVGDAVQFTVLATNNGLSTAQDVTISDAIPADVSNVSWTAVAVGNATITSGASGTGSLINVTGNIPAGGQDYIQIIINGTVAQSAGASINTTATAALPGGTVITSSNTTVTNLSTRPVVDIRLAGTASANAGDTVVYTIVVTNTGLSNATNIQVSDLLPAGLLSPSWSATASGGAAIAGGNVNSQSGNVSLTGSIPAGTGDSILIVVKGKTDPSLSGVLVNVASATQPGTGTVSTAPVNTVVMQQTSLAVSEAGFATANGGQTISYTITVTNAGPSAATGVNITNTLPVQLSNVSWTATGAGSASVTGGASGTGNALTVTGNITPGAGNSIQVLVTGTVDPAFTGLLSNNTTAATAGNTGVASNTVNTLVTAQTGLVIAEKGPAIAIAGDTLSYTITVTNAGPSSTGNFNISNLLPAQLQNISWTATATGNAGIAAGATGTGNSLAITGTIAPGTGNSIQVVVKGTVNPSFTGVLANSTQAAVPGVQPVSSAAVNTVVNPVSTLLITAQGPVVANPGQTVSYVIEVANSGPSNANNLNITQLVPVQLQNVTWTTAVIGNASVASGASGTGNNLSVTGSIAVDTSNRIRIVVTGTIDPNYSGVFGSNAQVALTGSPTVASNIVTTQVNPLVNVVLQNTAPAQANPAGNITFNVVATNVGLSTGNGVFIRDTIPAAVTNISWTAVPFGNATLTGAASGTGNAISFTANLPAGAQNYVQVVINGNVAADFTGILNTTANATTTSGTVSSSNTTATVVNGVADLAITLTGPAQVLDNNVIRYRIKISNGGPSAADGATVLDSLPLSLIGATVRIVSADGGAASITTTIDNANRLRALLGRFPAGATVDLEVTGTIAPQTSGSISNSATVTPPAGVTDPNTTTNNAAIALTNVLPRARLQIEKRLLTPAPYTAGKAISYQLKVINKGTIGVSPVTAADTLPSLNLISNPVIVQASTGTTATYNAASNLLSWNIGSLAAGDSVLLNYSVTVNGKGSFVNTATVQGPDTLSVGDTASVAFRNDVADLSIQNVLTTTGTLSVKDEIAFTVTITNNGPSEATGVQVTDILSSILDLPKNIVVSAGQASFEPSIRNLVWNVGNLPVGATATLTFTIRINAAGDITTTAMVTGTESDINMTNNTAGNGTSMVTGADIFIPHVITPNGDGKNDKWVILGLSRYPGSTVLLYNRWGNQVYRSPNYDNSWDGSGLSGGTYYYLLQVKTPQGIKEYKGWIELMR